MSDYYFHLQNMTVGYNKKPLIKDIEIGVNKGEIVTLIGPNGSGKSTILKSISRNLEILAGTVYLDNKPIKDMSFQELSRHMSVVLTERIKTQYMTCHEIVATGRYPYTGRLGLLTKEDEAIVEESMKRVHAEELGARNFGAISDGQRQRVLLARALCQQPEIILLDEPTSFLDIKHKLELLAILRSMAKEKNITVIMSLHEIDLAQKISDMVVCVKGEYISRFGKPEDVFTVETIRDLYEIDNGCYDPLFGSIELPRPEGEPKTMVLSSAGSGIPVFRKLQKNNTPFVAGILYTNDLDYELAKELAAEVVEVPAFAEMSEEAVQKAKDWIDRCDTVLCTDFPIGRVNQRIQEVIQYAQNAGKLQNI